MNKYLPTDTVCCYCGTELESWLRKSKRNKVYRTPCDSFFCTKKCMNDFRVPYNFDIITLYKPDDKDIEEFLGKVTKALYHDAHCAFLSNDAQRSTLFLWAKQQNWWVKYIAFLQEEYGLGMVIAPQKKKRKVTIWLHEDLFKELSTLGTTIYQYLNSTDVIKKTK